MTPFILHRIFSGIAAGYLAFCSSFISTALAQSTRIETPQETYADLVDLTDSTPLIIRAEIRKIVRLEPERSPDTRPGQGRFYVEARTKALLFGAGSMGESLRYLVDLPLDSRGKPPPLKKQTVLLFARAAAGKPGELQLVSRHAQLLATPEKETRLRNILMELQDPAAPPRITGIREAFHVAGPLTGTGETQIFFNVINDNAASITLVRGTDGTSSWGVSFSELVEGRTVPAPNSLAWYRLACFLPQSLPRSANLSQTSAEKTQAERDYRQIMADLGPCPRTPR